MDGNRIADLSTWLPKGVNRIATFTDLSTWLPKGVNLIANSEGIELHLN